MAVASVHIIRREAPFGTSNHPRWASWQTFGFSVIVYVMLPANACTHRQIPSNADRYFVLMGFHRHKNVFRI
jgi:hypothetical protein